MAIIDPAGSKSWKIRLLVIGMYTVLILLGTTMVYPFLITVTSSMSNDIDYQRFEIFPSWMFSREERFVRGMPTYFPSGLRGSMDQVNVHFANVPDSWGNWLNIGLDAGNIKLFADQYLAQAKNPAQWAAMQRQAAAYSDFVQQYALNDTICAYDAQDLPNYFQRIYTTKAKAEGATRNLDEAGLALLSKRWEVPYNSYYEITASDQFNKPMDQPGYYPSTDARTQDFNALAAAYRSGQLLPGIFHNPWRTYVKQHNAALLRHLPFPVTATDSPALQQLWKQFLADVTPLLPTRPSALKPAWLAYLGSPQGRLLLGLPDGANITIAEYNTVFGTHYASLRETPFPVPATATATLRKAWDGYLTTRYPLRLIEVVVSPALTRAYQDFLRVRLKNSLTQLNEIVIHPVTSYAALTYSSTIPAGSEAYFWTEFTSKHVPVEAIIPHSAESRYQQFLLTRYKNLDAINQAFGTRQQAVEQFQLPLDAAYLVTFVKNDRGLTYLSVTKNFAFVYDFLVKRGRAVLNTLIFILLTLFATLTVNPLAAFALSRFRMKQTSVIILYLLGTMAFPGAISMIPGFLLMRDLSLLNTYWALILPGLANGMSIFLLKGFFDSLPSELYEAATLDGCPEWQMFLHITLPLTKPILAVQALGAFMVAYSSWDWAIIVCQNPKMWTISVWLYQFAQNNASAPWVSMAAFLLASIPVMVVFLFCQNIILRGIILPQMK